MEPTKKLDEARRKAIDRLVATVSDANRPGLEAHLEECRNETIKETSLYSFAVPVAKADAILGKPFREATAEDFRGVVSRFRGIYSPQSLRLRIVKLRHHLRWVYQLDRFNKFDRLPRDLERVLWVRREKDLVVGQVIRDLDFEALLAGIQLRASLAPVFPVDVRDRALWRVLRASGFRVSEFISLNVGDIRFDGQDALLPLRRDAPDLKTGARTIWVRQGVPELMAWLSVHPGREKPQAPLWIQAQVGGIERMTGANVRRLLSRTCAWAGLDKKYPEPLTPHDFRHTCATEKARLGWNESQLRAYFGWGPGSKTPSTYVHLTLDDQRARIMKDAQVGAGQAMNAVPALAPNMAAVVDLLQDLLTRAARGTASTRA